MKKRLFSALVAMSVFVTPLLASPLVVTNDIGGRVDYRANQIARLQEQGRPVIIDGHCASSCTMYLAIGCITENARLVFHGPSFYGIPLNAHDFEYWSLFIASHYPEPLAEWYMSEGRYRTQFSQPLDTAQLVQLGATLCEGN